jgi:hypothetical protein
MEDEDKQRYETEKRYYLLACTIRQALLSIVAAIEKCFGIAPSTRTRSRDE